MKFFLPKDLTYYASNVTENEAEDGSTYVNYDVKLGYNIGAIRKYGINIYEALTTIYPLAHYIWEDAVVTDKYAVNLHTQTSIYPVLGQILIPIVSGVTVVYVRSNGKYYLSKTTGTIDFMAESITAPANFNEITTVPVPYRHEYQWPVGESDTLYWGYNSVANRYRALDRAVGTQTVKHLTDTLTQSFRVNAVNAASVYTVNATAVNLKVYDIINPSTPVQIYTSTIDMVDTSHLDTYEKVCTIPHRQQTAGSFLFDARYAMQLDFTYTYVGGSPAVGAVKTGLLDFLGQTLDGVDVNNKSYNQMEQRANGEMVWNKDNKETNKVHTLRYNIKLDTQTFDSALSLIKSITDKEVVLLGDDGDADGFVTLNNYGAITDGGGVLTSNNTKSTATISIENFT